MISLHIATLWGYYPMDLALFLLAWAVCGQADSTFG